MRKSIGGGEGPAGESRLKRPPLWDYNQRDTSEALAFSVSSISRWSLVSLNLPTAGLLYDLSYRCNGLGVHLN